MATVTHWVYMVYLLCCTLQLPLFVVLFVMGFSAQCGVMVQRHDLAVVEMQAGTISMEQQPAWMRRDGEKTPTNGTWNAEEGQAAAASIFTIYSVERRSLEPELCAMCCMSGLFAVFYMTLTSLAGEDSNLLCHEDAGSEYLHGLEMSSNPTTMTVMDEMMRLTFWLFVATQAWILAGVTVYSYYPGEIKPGGAELLPRLFLNDIVRLISLAGLCANSLSWRRPLTQFVCWVLYIAWWVLVLRDAVWYESQWRGLLIPLLGCDAILLIGHRYDTALSAQVALNCRLFYVAIAGIWTLSSIVCIDAASRS
jgi:hypothetical protein